MWLGVDLGGKTTADVYTASLHCLHCDLGSWSRDCTKKEAWDAMESSRIVPFAQIELEDSRSCADPV